MHGALTKAIPAVTACELDAEMGRWRIAQVHVQVVCAQIAAACGQGLPSAFQLQPEVKSLKEVLEAWADQH